MSELWLIGLVIVGCLVLLIMGKNGNSSHILTAVVSYLFGRKGKK